MMKNFPTEVEQEEFLLLMSLSLDGLLDEDEAATFEQYVTAYGSFAAQWQEWQSMHRQICAIPHAMPAPNFVDRFEIHLTQQERRQRLWQGLWIGLVTMVLWIGATAGILSIGTYLFVNQSTIIGDVVQNVIYFWAALASWFYSLGTSFNAFAATPQAMGLGVGYLALTMGLLAGWFMLLRRSTQLVESTI
ncbi:MAG: hypothetical protein R2932_09665 [Caldilineaceae bacterium]